MAFAAVRGTQLEVLMLLMALQFGYEDLTTEVGSIEASFSLGADISAAEARARSLRPA